MVIQNTNIEYYSIHTNCAVEHALNTSLIDELNDVRCVDENDGDASAPVECTDDCSGGMHNFGLCIIMTI